ncbi:hypothetical protein N658DRAFT_291717 [Parathielavia hyrcaniae]|uniref:Uncharacterized protein n=1 Tax=Parathielavia hyrcaniae TaxID=113614 RepID=A0AAN6PTB6_9PEZI|nr:hypothetical protein N658DRAFT_291717 [Parathielavia hyrcaniae]
MKPPHSTSHKPPGLYVAANFAGSRDIEQPQLVGFTRNPATTREPWTIGRMAETMHSLQEKLSAARDTDRGGMERHGMEGRQSSRSPSMAGRAWMLPASSVPVGSDIATKDRAAIRAHPVAVPLPHNRRSKI